MGDLDITDNYRESDEITVGHWWDRRTDEHFWPHMIDQYLNDLISSGDDLCGYTRAEYKDILIKSNTKHGSA